VPYLNRLADLLFVMARAADGGFRPVRTAERGGAPATISADD
jgi:cob(I)alamin adenosyltransferase